jgi:bacterioferritin-associated ferredoxin
MLNKQETEKVHQAIQKGLGSDDVLLTIAHVGKCEECQQKFREIINHSKQTIETRSLECKTK